MESRKVVIYTADGAHPGHSIHLICARESYVLPEGNGLMSHSWQTVEVASTTTSMCLRERAITTVVYRTLYRSATTNLLSIRL
jgi:hypothetical protein